MAFESGVVPEDWRSVVIIQPYKGKGERKECSSYRGITLLSVVGKICAGILVHRVRKVTEWGGVQSRKGVCRSDLHPKARKKECKVYVGFMDMEKAYYRVNREAL